MKMLLPGLALVFCGGSLCRVRIRTVLATEPSSRHLNVQNAGPRR